MPDSPERIEVTPIFIRLARRRRRFDEARASVTCINWRAPRVQLSFRTSALVLDAIPRLRCPSERAC